MIRIASARLIERAPRSAPSVWSARGEVTARGGLLLVIEDDRGRRGSGEASPLPGWSPEHLEEARESIAGFPWSEVSIDEGAELAPQITRAIERIAASRPSARFAVETALLDLAGRRLDRPVYELLAGHRHSSPVPVSALLVSEEERALVTEARSAIEHGARTLKWKIGRPSGFARELAALRALRRAVGPHIALRLDANGAFSRVEAPAMLDALAEVQPELIEEPVCSGFDELAPSPVPIAADETLRAAGGWSIVERAIAARICSTIVLKPMLAGGVLACLDLARRARSLGADAIVTHSFDGPVALAAAAALALALPSRRAAGLARHAGLAAWPDVALPMLANHLITALPAPGLGLPPMELE